MIILYNVSAFFVKLSLFLFYLRLFRPDRITRWLVYGGITTCGLFYSSNPIINCALCVPNHSQSNDTGNWLLIDKKCSKTTLYLSISQAVFGTLSDCYLLVIPIQLIFQLKLPTKRKIGVSAIFLVGIMFVYTLRLIRGS